MSLLFVQFLLEGSQQLIDYTFRHRLHLRIFRRFKSQIEHCLQLSYGIGYILNERIKTIIYKIIDKTFFEQYYENRICTASIM